MIVQNKGYAPGLAFSGHGVSKVNDGRLRNVLLYEDLLLVLFDDFVVLLFVDGHEFYQLMIYMHEMMMPCLVT